MSLYQIIKLGHISISQGRPVPKTIILWSILFMGHSKFAILAHSRRHYEKYLKTTKKTQTQTVKKSNNHIHRVITSHLQWQSTVEPLPESES